MYRACVGRHQYSPRYVCRYISWCVPKQWYHQASWFNTVCSGGIYDNLCSIWHIRSISIPCHICKLCMYFSCVVQSGTTDVIYACSELFLDHGNKVEPLCMHTYRESEARVQLAIPKYAWEALVVRVLLVNNFYFLIRNFLLRGQNWERKRASYWEWSGYRV